MWRKGNPSALLVGMQTGTVWNFLKKVKVEPPYYPVMPLLEIYPNNPETPILNIGVQKNVCTPMFIAVLLQ